MQSQVILWLCKYQFSLFFSTSQINCHPITLVPLHETWRVSPIDQMRRYVENVFTNKTLRNLTPFFFCCKILFYFNKNLKIIMFNLKYLDFVFFFFCMQIFSRLDGSQFLLYIESYFQGLLFFFVLLIGS